MLQALLDEINDATETHQSGYTAKTIEQFPQLIDAVVKLRRMIPTQEELFKRQEIVN